MFNWEVTFLIVVALFVVVAIFAIVAVLRPKKKKPELRVIVIDTPIDKDNGRHD